MSEVCAFACAISFIKSCGRAQSPNGNHSSRPVWQHSITYALRSNHNSFFTHLVATISLVKCLRVRNLSDRFVVSFIVRFIVTNRYAYSKFCSSCFAARNSSKMLKLFVCAILAWRLPICTLSNVCNLLCSIHSTVVCADSCHLLSPKRELT